MFDLEKLSIFDLEQWSILDLEQVKHFSDVQATFSRIRTP
jgi:hypothetical protein